MKSVYKDKDNFEWEIDSKKLKTTNKFFTDVVKDKWQAIVIDYDGDNTEVWIRNTKSSVMLLAFSYRKSNFPDGFDEDKAITDFIGDNFNSRIWGM